MLSLRLVTISSMVLLAAGCATVRRFNGLRLQDDAVYVNGVPPVHQDGDYACGPACLAAVAASCGVALSDFKARFPREPADLTGDDLARLAHEAGLEAFAYRGSMADLQQNLRAGRPVIVMIPMPLVANAGLAPGLLLSAWNEIGPRPSHWVTVLGLLGDRQVIVQDPASGPLLISRQEFEAWWAKCERVCVLVAPSAPRVASDLPKI